MQSLKEELNAILLRKVGIIKFMRTRELSKKSIDKMNELEAEVKCIANYQIEVEKLLALQQRSNDRIDSALRVGIEYKKKYNLLDKSIKLDRIREMVVKGWITETYAQELIFKLNKTII